MLDANARVAWQRRKARQDRLALALFRLAGLLAGVMLILILLFVGEKGFSVFFGPQAVSFTDFLTGLRWRQDQGVYGVGFIIINTLITAFGASILAFPTAVLSALLIAKVAPPFWRNALSTVLEVLAAIPSVVYGVFASGKITAWVDSWATALGYSSFGGKSILAVVLLLAIMIYPTMTAIAVQAISVVPRRLEDASLALGASVTQTHFKIVLRAARSGIFTGLILGLGRAFGEATAVSMVAGNAFTGPSWNPFDITRTLTSTMLSGLKETSGLDYDIRFTVGMVLMILILASNAIIHLIKKRMGGQLHD